MSTARRAGVSAPAPAASAAEPNHPAPWIAVVSPEEADGELRATYDWQAARRGKPTEFTQLGSLYPPLVLERLRLYKTVEAVPSRLSPRSRAYAAYVTSILNRTRYCASGGRLKLLESGVEAVALDRLATEFEGVRAAVAGGAPIPPELPAIGDERLDAIAAYALHLTLKPGAVSADRVEALRKAGLDDLDILDTNNIVAYYNYVNRVANGLGLRHAIDDPAEALHALPA